MTLHLLTAIKDKVFFLRFRKRLEVWHRLFALYLGLFLIWGLYRLLFRFPVFIEEIFLKGIVFGLPIIYLTLREDHRLTTLGLELNRTPRAIFWGVSLGVLLIGVNQLTLLVKPSPLATPPLTASSSLANFFILALITAFWEQLVFAGYFLSRLSKLFKSEWSIVVVTGALFTTLHLPALIVADIPASQVAIQLFLIFILGISANIVMLRTQNLLAPMLTQALWGVSIALYR
ncbi:hypothetical protein A3A66_03555 [Microgenomates group bacterium RIFCSPLOWO2_01_FULL_46_13]|nr:MAG: hypothetical protein A2783_04735 [Microgenomates group bacterium RIFCSPHIGHO2_01_FULL_45_11]OGV95060.1 MAG: hypothetical protein A3A66_03555 [Microgenomates group bacterium RIFCSPLOWO2_01_FULL_46_13]